MPSAAKRNPVNQTLLAALIGAALLFPHPAQAQAAEPQSVEPQTTQTQTNHTDPPPPTDPDQPQPPQKPRTNPLAWANEKIAKRVRAFGERRLGYHIQSVSGDREAYNVTNLGGFGNQRFTDLGFLRLEGRQVLGWINFDANIQDARFIDPQAQRYRLWTDVGPWSAQYGDIRAALPGDNPYARFVKQVDGVELSYKAGGLEARLLRSEARGQARTVTIPGNNTAGPYFLQSSQIVRGSERVEIDGVIQQFGTDYTIDYDLGAVTFVNRQTLVARVIPPTSTIVATYESFAFNGRAGRLEGGGLTYTLPGGTRLGLSAMRQVTGATNRLSTRVEKFQGFGPPSTPYFLQFEPLPNPAPTIRVDGVLQIEGPDYRFDPENRSIFYFNRFMPPTSDIDVLYTPRPTSSATGDREVVGLEANLPLPTGNLRLYQATGRTVNAPSTTSGTARGAVLRLAPKGPWQIQTSVRDVPAGFVAIEAANFNRNEQAADFNLRHAGARRGDINLSYLNSSVSRINPANSTVSTTRFTRSSATYTLTRDPARAWPLTLTTSRTESRTISARSKADTIGLETNRNFGPLALRLGLENQRVSGTTPADLLTSRLTASYDPSQIWRFTLGGSLSAIRSQGLSGTGTDLSLSANYNPTENFSTRLSYSQSDAGRLPNLSGFLNGFGAGFDGNGFSAGAGSSFGTGATNGRNLSLFTSWSPADRLSLRGNATLFRSSGNFSANAETTALSGGLDWDLGSGHLLTGDLAFSNTRYIGANLTSSATTLAGALSGAFGKLDYRAAGTILLTGGSGQFQQDSIAFDLSLRYPLAPRHNLTLFAASGQTSRYLPQNDFDLNLTYQYQIWSTLALNVRYRFRDVANRDNTFASGAYRSNALDFELAFNFGG